MSETARKSLMTFGVTLALGIGFVGWSRAQAAPAQAPGPHGGLLEKTKRHQFEVVFSRDGVKVYPFTADGKPLDAGKLTGTAVFYHPQSPNPWFDRPLRPRTAIPGQTSPSLESSVGLSNAPATGGKVAFEITGLSDAAEPTVSFTAPLTLAPTPSPAARSAPATITYAPATRADQAAIKAQRACKISGEALGSMGGPIKVSRGNQSTFLCCKGCLKTLMAAPDRYLGQPPASSDAM